MDCFSVFNVSVIFTYLFFFSPFFAARLFHQAFISFRKYIMESSSLSADLHIILNDICCGAGKYLEWL